MKPVTVLAAATALGLSLTPALAESRTYDVPAFESVSVSAGISAIVESGPAQAVTADASTAAVLERLRVEVRGSRLEIDIDWNLLDYLLNLGQHRQITVHVSAPRITTVEAHSGSDVDVSGMNGTALTLESTSGASLLAKGVSGTSVNLEASSGAGLDVTGTCDRVSADASSGAHVEAVNLVCGHLNAEASSGGRVTAYASTSVEADASSGGGVSVHGHPTQVDTDSSSGGWVDVVP